MLLPEIDCFATILRLAYDGHVRFAPNQRDQTFAPHRVVVGDENADARFFGCGLRAARSRTGRARRRTSARRRGDWTGLAFQRAVPTRGASCSFARRFRFHDLDSPSYGTV